MAQRSQQLAIERRRLRTLRHAVTGRERREAERHIVASLRRLGCTKPGRRVALYLARDGEPDLAAFIRMARHRSVRLYAPRITSRRRRTIRFLPLITGGALPRNWYGIAEPAVAPSLGIGLLRLDTVLAPLVGFDRHGNRLGNGAGYYDRALRRRLPAGRSWRRPRIIGIAFACQESDALIAAPWDVPLDLIVTERGVLRPAHGRSGRDGSTT
jgi:5-formyltetrahydrofolate cyclo-ligase